MDKKHKEYLVSKSNELINSRYSLTSNEQKIILYIVSHIQPKEETIKNVTFSIKDFCELLGLQGSTKYTELKKTIKGLMDKSFWVKMYDEKRNEEVETVFRWIEKPFFYPNSGEVSIRLDEDMMPFLLDLQENYTSYKLKNILKLQSAYSIRIYELLKSIYEKIKGRENKYGKGIEKEKIFTIEELKNILDVKEKYPAYKDFKNRVILQAQKELMEKTDISFEFEEIKKGKKVDELKIKIFLKSSSQLELSDIQPEEYICATIENIDEEPQRYINALQEYNTLGIKEDEFKEFLKITNYDVSRIKRLLKYTEQQKDVKSAYAYMKTAITKKWEI